MPTDYEVSPAIRSRKPFGIRINRLTTGTKSFDGLATAYRKGIPTGALPGQGIQEVFLSTSTEALEGLTDEDARTTFLRQAAFGLDGTRVNLFFTRLTVTDPGLLTDEAVTILYDLLNHPQNDLLVVPTFAFEGAAEQLDLPQRLALYDGFVDRFLKVNKDTGPKRVAFTCPSIYSKLEPLLESLHGTYERHGQTPQFFLVDMGAQRLTTSYPRLGPVHRLAKKRHGKDSDYFVYAASLAPFKRSSEAQPAEDVVALASCGINAIGPKHGPPAVVKDVPGQSPLSKLPKLFDPKQLHYTKLNDAAARSVAAWATKHGRRPVEGVADLKSGHVHGFNAVRFNTTAQEIAGLVKAGDHQGLVDRFEPTPLFESIQRVVPIVASNAVQKQLA